MKHTYVSLSDQLHRAICDYARICSREGIGAPQANRAAARVRALLDELPDEVTITGINDDAVARYEARETKGQGLCHEDGGGI